MIDPITIASAANGSFSLANKIFQYIVRLNETDGVVKDLGEEIESLGHVLNGVKGLETASTESLEGPGKQHWKDIEASLTECHEKLEKLNDIFRKVDKVKKRSRLVWKQIKYDWNLNDIQRLKDAIANHRRGIQINLSMITMYYPE
jgi:Fungal N-terminal domain of STAND proteins